MVGYASPFFLSTNKKFIHNSFFQLYNKKFKIVFPLHNNKRTLKKFRSSYSPRTKSRSNVRVNVLPQSNVLAQTNEKEIVLLRNLIRFLFIR